MYSSKPDDELLNEIYAEWQALRPLALKGHDLTVRIARIEHKISEFEATADLMGETSGRACKQTAKLARRYHTYMLSVTEAHESNLATIRDFWTSRSDWMERFSTQMFQECLKYALALHGATAVAFLAALSSKEPSPSRPIFVFGLTSSLIGLVLMSIALGTLISVLAHLSSTIFAANLSHDRRSMRFRAIPRWMGNASIRKLRYLVSGLLLVSTAWFVIYMFVIVLYFSTS